ncbi:MAG: hypothetical protein NUV49_03045, partial [Patescibacteria group bacterium]|nr:hypothetical protein [Patescibacteria group bacterium]
MTSRHIGQLIILGLVVALIFGYAAFKVLGGTFFSLTLNSNASLEQGLVGYWTFDGADMVSNVADVSGQGNHGTLSASFAVASTTFLKIGQTTTTIAGNDSNEDITLPGVLAAGDIVLVGAASDGAIGGQLTTSGYALIDNHTGSSAGSLLGWKRMGSTPDTVVNFNNADNSQVVAVVIQVWRGVDSVTAIDATPVLATGASGDPNPGSFTTVTANTLRVIWGALDDDDVASGLTAPSGFENLIAGDTGQSSTGAGATAMLASRLEPNAGANNPDAFGTSGDDQSRTYHFALRQGTTTVATT